MRTNPLLEDFSLPFGAPPFDKIEENDYLPAVKAAIEEARANIDAIKANPAEPDFDNVIVALETASDRLGMIAGIFYNQLSAGSTDRMESLALDIGPLSSNFSSDVTFDMDLFAKVKAVWDKRESLTLTTEQQTLLDDTYKGFVRGGALLDEDKKARLREISEKMSMLGPAFSNNVKKSAEAFQLVIDDPKDLAGLPDSAITAALATAEEKNHHGKWVITLDFPSYVPFLTYADNRALREQVWRAFSARAFGDEYDNCQNIKTLLTLRYERAQLLGYKNHADYVLERRMAKTPEAVMAFLNKLLKTYKAGAQKELEELKVFARESGGPDEIKPWDIAYYSEKLKQKRFDFSSEDFRPYFPLTETLEGVFAHFTKLFGLQFKKIDSVPVWHEDVVVYEVTDTEDGRHIGLLYGDFFPRSGKKPGAWMTSYRAQGLHGDKIERPLVAIVCNFTKPGKDKPSLITFDEVETLFHEMGHAVHMLCSDVTYASQAGPNVLWDFVELPSQVQENWAATKETLDLFAHHYETGEKIPAELIDKLNAAKNFMGAWTGLRQTNFGLLDMAWYSTDPAAIDSIPAFEDEVTRDSSLFPRMGGPASTSFSHIFAGGYAAGYYSYKWAEVLDADTFELFKEKGLYDQETARKYRQEVLAKGGSDEPATLYRNFRGRDADPEALLRREGLTDSKAA